MRIIYLLLLLMMNAAKLVVAATSTVVGDYVMTVWRTEDGLPQNSVFTLAEGTDGYLWLGTRNGLARFDGVNFKTFYPEHNPGLTHNRIQLVFAQRNGTIWIGAENNSISSYYEGKFHLALKFPENATRSLQQFLGNTSSGMMFSVSHGGLLEGTPEKLTLIDPPPEFHADSDAGHVVDSQGVIWMVTHTGQVTRFASHKFEALPPELGLTGKMATHVLLDAGGKISVVTEAGLEKLTDGKFQVVAPETKTNATHMLPSRDGGFWVWSDTELFKSNSGSFSNRFAWTKGMSMRGAMEDSLGRMWCATYGEGLWRVDQNGERTTFGPASGLPGTRVYAVLEDRHGNLMVGVDGGLVRLQPSRFKTWTGHREIVEPNAMTVCPDGKGGVWMGTYGGGLLHYHDGDWEHVVLPGLPPKAIIYCVLQDRTGVLWFGTRNQGFLRLADGAVTRVPSKMISSRSVRVLYEDSKRNLWIGDTKALHVIHLDTGTSEPVITPADIRAVREDKDGNLWVGTQGRGLLRWRDGKLDEYRKSDGLAGDFVWCILPEADGTLWIGTAGAGISRLKNGKFTNVDVEDGLPDNTITQLQFDDQGRLWAGSYHGVFSVTRSSLISRMEGGTEMLHCVRYGSDDGLPAAECSGGVQPNGARTEDGRMWFPTSGGIAALIPAKVKEKSQTLTTVIESFTADNQPILPGGKVQAGAARYAVKFTAPTMSSPQNVHFRYRLDGLHGNWIEAETRREAFFDRLGPGNYTFRVMASNRDGAWDGMIAQQTFAVLPFFWQTKTFQVATTIAVVILIAAIARYISTRELRRRLALAEQKAAMERERERISRDMHDTIGTRLTTISLLGDLARRGDGEIEERQSRLKKLSDLAGETAATLGTLIWTVNPANDTLDNLTTRLCQETDEFLRDTQIEPRFDIPERLPRIVVSSETRRQLVLAVAESVNNAVKHSGASELQLSLSVEASEFVIRISDNGRGLPEVLTPKMSGGNGLPNIRERLVKCGGSAKIENRRAGGVLVELRVPIGRG